MAAAVADVAIKARVRLLLSCCWIVRRRRRARAASGTAVAPVVVAAAGAAANAWDARRLGAGEAAAAAADAEGVLATSPGRACRIELNMPGRRSSE
jgi:hypothetical protein